MIAVATGSGGQIGGDARAWFERAVAAQLDYELAYASMLWSLLPRWGGSYQQMYELGLECLATRRFDTRVPWTLVIVLKNIVLDDGARYTFWRRPGVAAKLSECARGYAETPVPPAGAATALQPAWYRSFEVAALWRAGDVDTAARCLAVVEKEGRLDDDAVGEVDAWGGRVAEEVRAMGGPLGAEVRAAEQFAIAGMVPQAEEAFAAQLAALDKPDAALKLSDPAARFIRVRAREIELYQKLEAGETVSIQPDKEMLGWYAVGGTWAVDGDGPEAAIVGTSGGGDSGGRGAALLMYLPAGNRFELRGRIEFVAGDAPGGVLAVAENRAERFAATFDRRSGEIVFTRTADPHRATARPAAGLPAVNDFAVLVWDGRVGLENNGERALGRYVFQEPAPTGRSHVGLAIRTTAPGTTIRVSRLTLARLTEQPTGLDAPPPPPPPPPQPRAP